MKGGALVISKKRISVDMLGIEVTRKCNLKCKHCCRGEAQNLDIELCYIDQIFNFVGYVKTLIVTGGEPAMNIAAVEHINDVIRQKGVYVESISMVTNGMYKFDELCRVTRLLCDASHGIWAISVSTDKYHNTERQTIMTALKGISKGHRLMLLEKNLGADDVNLFAAGRAKNLGAEKKPYYFNYPVMKHKDYYSIIHLTAKGNIVAHATGEFLDEDNSENIICKVCETKSIDDFVKSIEAYNNLDKVRCAGMFHYLFEQFTTCQKCPQWKSTYQNKINYMAHIADQEWNIPDIDKEQFLKERYWHNVIKKLVTYRKVGDPFSLCDWWNTHKRDESKDLYVVDEAQQIIADRIVEYNKQQLCQFWQS